MLPIAMNYVSEALGTEVTSSNIDISFFDELQLKDVLALDSEGDTLIYIQKLNADIGLFSFFSRTLRIDHIENENVKINLVELSRDKYNFNHILEHLNSSESDTTKSESKPWDISFNTFAFNDFNFELINEGGDLRTTIPKLSGDFKSFNIDKSIYHLSDLSIEGINLAYNESGYKSDFQTSTSLPTLPIDLLVDNISIQGQNIEYNKNAQSKNNFNFDPNHISTSHFNLEGSNLAWSDSILVQLDKIGIKMKDGFEIEHLSSDIVLTDQKIDIGQTKIQTKTSNIDFNGKMNFASFDEFINNILDTNIQLEFQKSDISKSDLDYFLDNYQNDRFNFNVLDDIDFTGKIINSNGNITAHKIALSIGDNLQLYGTIQVASSGQTRINFDIQKLKSSQDYLEKLLPTFKFPKELNNLGEINSNATGQYQSNEVDFTSISLKTGSGTRLVGSGKIYNIKDISTPRFNFFFEDLNTNLNSVFSDKSILPEELQRLEDIQYSGKVEGDLRNIELKGSLLTSLGNLETDSKFQFNDDYTDGQYDGYFKLENFDVGRMLNDTTYGIANFTGNISGSGLSIDKLKSQVNGKISSFYYDGYNYQDILVEGSYSDKLFNGKVVSNDENFNLNFDGKVDFRGSSAVMDLTMDMRSIDLKELGFTDSLMILGGMFRGKINGNSIDEILGEGIIENFSVRTQKGSYFADSTIFVNATKINETEKVFSLESPFMDGEIKGEIKPSTLIRFVKNYIKAYIPLEIGYDEDIDDNLDKYFEEHDDQNFILSATTKNIDSLLIPFLGNGISLKKATLGANFSSEETRLDIKGKIDSLLYKGILFQRSSYFFDGKKSFINGNVNIEDISMDNEILVPITTINTVLNNKIADFNLVMENEDYEERLNLSGDMTRTDEYIITFNDSIYMNGFNWHFSPYNQVIFGDYGLFMQDLKLSKENQAITIYTDENENGDAIEVLFDKFTLSELTAIIDKENDYFEGEIDGALLINSIYFNPFVTADLSLNKVTVAGKEVGKLTIEAAQDLASNSVKSNIRLSGPQNDATLKLDFGIENQSTVGELDIGKLEMAIIDPYLTNVFINSEGYVNGKITINGDINNLDLKGKLRTHDIKTTPVFTNSRYAVLDTDISFTDREIDFGTVELKDKNNNSAFVKGKINHRNLRSSVIDLKVNTDNFEFLNTTENENELFHGNVNVSGNVSVFGPIDDIVIDGSVSAINDSKLIVSPLSIEEKFSADNFIIYSGDPRIIPFDSLTIEEKKPSLALPFDIDLKVNVQKDSEFSLIMDPITGDKLTCYGQSNLNLKLSKEGKMELFGIYTVSKGLYTFSWGPLTKEFNIQPGSTVNLNGDPLDGILDVDAVYVANTSVYDLLQLESGLKDAQISEAQRKRDINVILSLTNSIQKPEISLDITSDENDLSSITDILNNKLAQLRTQPSELNNQVFGLLLFGNFILAKNAETDLAKTTTDLAISSLSSLVSTQLNKLADGLIEGFEVNLDFDAYSSDFLSLGDEGLITEFGFGVKKTLFDNRLTISAETNVNLESSTKASDFNTIAGNFILEYKLNKNGNYIFKAFRKSIANRLGIDETTSKNGASIFIRNEFGEIKKKKK